MTGGGASADKAALRARALAARDAVRGAADTIFLSQALRPYPRAIVAGYWPIRSEADPLPALRGHPGPMALPVVVAAGQALIFRLWDGQTTVAGRFGAAVPPEDAAVVRPDVVIVPLVGFDRSGHRLGYGGGYYDRTLSALRAGGPVTAIGFAHSAQELDPIAAEATDQRLDMIVTEAGIIQLR
ncbi:5-formyltetrahydrofolate cyclo-ligase [Paracoccus pacificus]|uniref:5-formyltetrahydrofolate cyclo-ligase n=1 Tax=Paracoccus pacificus TaxID=1463598 RepID=A0ABW4RA71_9RHOB